VSAHKDLLARVAARVAVATADAAAAAAAARADADAGAPPAPRASVHARGFSRDEPEDRQLLVSFLLHSADLCNPLLPPPLSRRIAATLSAEFEAQARAESGAGVAVTVMLASDDVAKAKMEVRQQQRTLRRTMQSLC
jgi:hypothetical protein